MIRRIATFALFLVLLSGNSSAVAQSLFVTTTTYEITGSASAMDMEPPFTTQNDLYTIHSDAVVRRHGDLVFVVNRFLADNVLVLDAGDDFDVVTQYSTGLDSNPYDVEVVSTGRAYVSRYDESSMLVVEPATGTGLGSIDLSVFADADGTPEMSQIAAVGDRAFVAIQRLDRTQPLWPPLGTSVLAVIDTGSDTLVDADPETPALDGIALPLQNPSGDVWYDRTLHRLLVVCSGDFLDLEDGGIVAVNPFTFETEVVVTEAVLGGNLNAARIVSPELGYAVVSDAQFRTCLVRFDPGTGTRLDQVLCTSGSDLADVEVGENGLVYVADRTAVNPGIRIYDAVTGQLVAGPVSVGLPPYDLVLLDESAHGPLTSTPTSPRTVAAMRAWPNPFNPHTQIEWVGMTGAPRSVRILDARGRTVRTLPPSSSEAGRWRYEWDGKDRAGRDAASGVYHAVPVGGSSPTVDLTLVR